MASFVMMLSSEIWKASRSGFEFQTIQAGSKRPNATVSSQNRLILAPFGSGLNILTIGKVVKIEEWCERTDLSSKAQFIT